MLVLTLLYPKYSVSDGQEMSIPLLTHIIHRWH